MTGRTTPRREWGSGSCFQRKDSRWVASSVNPAGGRFYGTGATAKEAQRRLRERSASSGRNPLTVADVLARWLRDRRRVLRARTMGHYDLYTKHAIAAFGDVRVDRLTADQVRGMLSGMTGYAPQSQAHALKVLRSALNWGIREGLVEKNPAALVQSPRVPRPDFRVLSPAEVGTFLDANRDSELYALWVLAATTGMRRGEVLGLEWRDVDLVRGTVRVRQTLRPIAGRRFAFEEPKTTRSARTLTLPRIAVAALNDHPRGLGTVFAHADGLPLNPRSVLRAYKAALRRAGLPMVTFHSLRHGVAQMLLDASGGDLRMVGAQLGHASISTTVNRYGGMADESRRRAGEMMDRLVPEREVV